MAKGTFPDPATLTGLHLFYNPYSNCAQRVMLVMAEKGLEPEMHLVDLMKSAQLSESYTRINPKGEVPALVHDGRAMHESCDILRYVEDHFPSPSLVPAGADDRERMEQLLDAAAGSHEPGVVNYVYSNGYGRLPTPTDWDFYQQNIPHRAKFHRDRRQGLAGSDPADANRVLAGHFGMLEQALNRGDWLAGDEFSLADIAWFPNTIILRQLGYSFAEFPRVSDWIRRMENRETVKTAIRARQKNIPDCVLRGALKLLRKTGGRQ